MGDPNLHPSAEKGSDLGSATAWVANLWGQESDLGLLYGHHYSLIKPARAALYRPQSIYKGLHLRHQTSSTETDGEFEPGSLTSQKSALTPLASRAMEADFGPFIM